MGQITSSPYAAVFVGLVLLLGLYVSAYLAMMTPVRSIAVPAS